jgi:hypothetical protein
MLDGLNSPADFHLFCHVKEAQAKPVRRRCWYRRPAVMFEPEASMGRKETSSRGAYLRIRLSEARALLTILLESSACALFHPWRFTGGAIAHESWTTATNSAGSAA